MPKQDAIIASQADILLIADAVQSLHDYSGFVKIVDDGDKWRLRDTDDQLLATVQKAQQ